jgi:hypothetical protein
MGARRGSQLAQAETATTGQQEGLCACAQRTDAPWDREFVDKAGNRRTADGTDKRRRMGKLLVQGGARGRAGVYVLNSWESTLLWILGKAITLHISNSLIPEGRDPPCDKARADGDARRGCFRTRKLSAQAAPVSLKRIHALTVHCETSPK